ncbi:MAG: glycosyltransferase [Eubacteriales bacterium]|nr:glycosyltransferase [Eubacteriales bacterium]
MNQLISFILPCYGSEKTIEFVTKEIRDTVAQRPEYDYEIIAVNDCSPDHVWDVLQKLAAQDHKIRLLGLAKNMNRPGAVMAGLGRAVGDYMVIMDDDGQCPMNHFWALLEPLANEDYDVAMADYPTRKQSVFKDFGTIVNKKMTEFILDRPKNMQFTNFMAMRRYIAREICKYRNPYPYMTGLLLRTTRRIICVPMEERERFSGSSNFTFKKMLALWMNGFTAFSVKPLRVASVLGVLCAVFGVLFGLYIIIAKLVNPAIAAGYSSLMAALLFIGGVIMLILGMIGEYIGRIYISINDSPQYVIRDEVNFDYQEKSDEEA